MPNLTDYPSIANADRFSAFNSSAQQRSVRSLLLEPDGYLEDGFYRFGDDNYLSELSSNEMTDLQNPARTDASFHKSSRNLHSAFPPVDSSKSFYHSPSFSLNLFGNDPAPRFHDGMNRMRPSSQKDLLSSPILSEPPLFSDIEPLVPQHRPPLFSERPSHSRMYSSPSFNAPSLFSHSANPSDCLLSHSRHNSELRGFPKDDFPPDFPSFAPAADIALPPEPVKKLPYACRDFKNGKCTRGENCRFLHVYEGICDGVAIMHSDGRKSGEAGVCWWEFLRGRRMSRFVAIFCVASASGRTANSCTPWRGTLTVRDTKSRGMGVVGQLAGSEA